MDVPPLATTSPGGTLQVDAGVLGRSTTEILFGDSGLMKDSRSGGRYTLGIWLDPDQTQGLDFTYLSLEDETETFSAPQGAFSILARPFLNVQSASQDARLIAFPGFVEGSLVVDASTEFQAAEVVVRRLAACGQGSQVAYVFGYRFAELKDQLRIGESTLSLSGPTAGASFQLFDLFETRNSFHGGELGLIYTGPPIGGWTLELSAKLALGSTRGQGSVLGQTTATALLGGMTTTQAGLLTQGTNIGAYEDDQFSTISEFGLRLRNQFNCRFATTIGYEFIHWSDVMRAGDQVDLGVNVSQIPPGSLSGEPRPAFPFDFSDVWVQGFHFGIEFWF